MAVKGEASFYWHRPASAFTEKSVIPVVVSEARSATRGTRRKSGNLVLGSCRDWKNHKIFFQKLGGTCLCGEESPGTFVERHQDRNPATSQSIFESIIFVFVMHPFDVGDRCVVDGVQMVVEEMNILTTVFLRYDAEKIYYPNSILHTKPISNFRRSPDMGDGVDITIDVSTSVDDFNALKKAIQVYIESKPKHWNPNHTLMVCEIENGKDLKLTLCVQHTMNHQNFGEKSNRRSELVFELKKIFDRLGIKYHLLPQQVNVTHVNTSSNGGRSTQS
ncbi:hypothetical protein OIU77_004355 [Salix suchowensis]|uniref:Mechanosensitive ion channel MscS domain-containing protein n=1 Tax=Salix suchowensis TaxID=1278906 RepID=A0ABQ9AU68_9ROSI|nr:hypothetical protein OIU77_004355 [Salix suchowensis]